jgi:hypothetical protein
MDIVLQLRKILQFVIVTPRRRRAYIFVFSTISMAYVKHAPWECMLSCMCVPSALGVIYNIYILYMHHLSYYYITIRYIFVYHYLSFIIILLLHDYSSKKSKREFFYLKCKITLYTMYLSKFKTVHYVNLFIFSNRRVNKIT